MPQNISLMTFRSESQTADPLLPNGQHDNSLSSTVAVASSTAGHEAVLDEQTPVDAKDALKPRGQWASRYEFVLSHLGFCIGLGNVWRFPYICYKNGGGAFFIPYIICLCCAGIPVAFLEVALGQYFATGGISCWDICPLFRGIGYASTVILFWLNVYYIVVLAWGALYLFYCFCYIGYDLPWTTCNNEWNTPQCYANFSTDPHARFFSAPSGGGPNRSVLQHAPVDPATEFWEHKILNISDGIDNIGSLNGHLSLSLLIVWIVCFFCVWKGVRTAGKVVYVTAIFPYGMLALLVVRGMTLPGAFDGIYYYMKPDLSKLGDSSVWVDAGTQVFFSLTVGLSSLTGQPPIFQRAHSTCPGLQYDFAALSSYNAFNYNCYKHTLYLCTVDVLTSFFAGLAVFSVLGFMAEQLRVPIETVAESGPGLAFVVYPTAMAQMPGAIAWAIFFFVMLILLGLDTQVRRSTACS
ncbi:hypothetical protein RvY_06373 [Ramazzottius varieornatus]|uniref:Transporter n=1 Tax=Ramazzottius varieornatus TaxID=947166 RepID=A0A1D1UYD4_RAMVA|nr:hypothetical protein RvY_06373 [Ramazzottius varieornatus]